MTTYNIGIDTGGTYTDAVIVDTLAHAVIATAKSLTTKGNLDIGVVNALGAVMRTAEGSLTAAQIGLVSLSTTLATNALVEGVGSSVATVLIGFSDDMVLRSNLRHAIPGAKVIRLDGGHQYDGSETSKLDEAALENALRALDDSVEAYAIAATYSIRNPRHEQRAKQIIEAYCNRPVTISSELSDGLNGPMRALTATFNVRIVSLILNLVQSVRKAMALFDIQAPLMIVKGDGSIASAESVIDKPIETILSGPAASVIGANFISNLNDFIISDVGGTTTDVAVVRNGWPSINEKGAMAGGFRTLVRAIDMQTIGLGGDSEVDINYKGVVSLKHNRVVPMSLICDRFPVVIEQLRARLGNGMGLAKAIQYIFLPEGFEPDRLPTGLVDADLQFIQQIDTVPRPYDAIVIRASDRARAERLLDRGIIQLSGLTPSDAAHVLGLQSQWSAEGARLACLMLGRSYGLISWKEENMEAEIEAFATRIFDETVGKSAYLIVNQLSGFDFAADNPLIRAVTHGNNQVRDLAITIKPKIPIVAVGGPAQVFYPKVGERLNVTTVIPHNADVANAIGAAIGRIKIRVSIEITSTESGGYHIHHLDKPVYIVSQIDALEQASQMAHNFVIDRARSMGGSSPEVKINLDRVDLPNMDKNRSLISAIITAECLSTPGLQAVPSRLLI